MPKIPELPPFDLPYTGNEVVVGVNADDEACQGPIKPIVDAAALPHVTAAADYAATALAASNAVQASTSLPWVIQIDRTDGTKSVPVLQWQPRLHATRVLLNGQVTNIAAISNLPAGGQPGAGGRVLTKMPAGLAGGYTRAVRVKRTSAANPSGTIISMATSASSLANAAWINAKNPINGAMTVGMFNKALALNPNSERAATQFGMEWIIESVPASGDILRLVSGRSVENLGAVGVYAAPTHMAIGANLAVASTPLAGAIVEDVIVIAGALDAAEMEQLGARLELDWGKKKSPVPAWLPPDDVLADDGSPLNEVIGTAYFFEKGLAAPTKQWAWEKRRGCNGRLKSLNDIMIDPAGGNYVLKRGPDLKAEDGITTLVDGYLPNLFQANQLPSVAPLPGTILFGSRVADSGGFGERHAISTVMTGTAPPAGIQEFSVFASSTGVSASRAFTKPLGGVASAGLEMGTSMGNSRGNRTHRLIATQKNGSAIKTIWNANMISEIGPAVTNYQPQDYWRMHSGYNNNQPISEHWTSVRVIIFTRALSDAEQDRLAGWNIYGLPKILFVHDSGGNFGQAEEAFHVAQRDKGFNDYMPTTSGGLGGRGFWWHRDFLRELTAWKPQFREYLPISWEMGLDFQGLNLAGVFEGPFTEAQMVAMREEIDGMFDYPMVWMGANTNKSSRQLQAALTILQNLQASGTATAGQIASAQNNVNTHQFEMDWVLGVTELMKKRYPDRFIDITPRIQEWFETPELKAEGIDLHYWPNQFFIIVNGQVTDTIHIIWFPGTDRYASAYYMIGQAIGDYLLKARWLRPALLAG